MDENGNRTEDKRHSNPGDSDIDTFLQYGRYQALRVWGLGSIIGKETRQFFFTIQGQLTLLTLNLLSLHGRPLLRPPGVCTG